MTVPRFVPRSIREGIPDVHREGWPFIGVTVALAFLFLLFFTPGFWLWMILAGWMVIFFRNPVRAVPLGPGLVVSPADGRIEPLVRVPPPPELGLGAEPLTRVSVFMNVFDCHINRAPVGGRVARVAYKPGKFVSADLDKASDDNERNSVLIETDGGLLVGVVQVAGLVARRIVCWTRDGARIEAGERFGMIRFGSRLDVYLPEGSIVAVSPRQRAVSGETILAYFPGANATPPFQTRYD
jgi:phosphatidylserine decarboxylase